MKKPTPFGKYYLLERINVGGMAEVFRAKAFGVEGFERLVAVKRILPNIAEDKEFIRMFIEEAKLAVQLNHANIAQIFDLGVVDGAYYIALEHIHGRDLRGMFDRCRQLGETMPVSQACFVVMKVCEGLDYAHNKRDQAGRELHLVHRDVSPQNVLVSFEGEVKLIDFGIAKAAGKGSKTQAGILKGKFGYMSPEQVRGIPIDRRSDVFSCGIVLYELLTGERLFVGESDFSTLEKVRNVEILPPSTYNRKIPDELERIVLKALAKDPDDRYANAIDLHDELQAFVYTAGEFYSRKDLAGWMKKTFGREIEEETAKLESYRQLKAPAELPAARAAVGTRPPATTPIRKTTTLGMERQDRQDRQPPGQTKPPPPPVSPRHSQQMPAVSAAAPQVKPKSKPADGEELVWDDDELETQIYDNPDDEPNQRPRKSSAMPVAVAPPQSIESRPTLVPPITSGNATAGPDLSSLVSTGQEWDGVKPISGANGAHVVPTLMGSGQNGTHGPNGNGAAKPMPMFGATNGAHAAPSSAPAFPVNVPEPSLPIPLISTSPELLFDPMASYTQGISRQKSRGMLPYLAIGGAVVAVIVAVVVIAVTGTGRHQGHQPTDVASKPAPPPAATTASDPSTGFDLYVSPAGVTTWRLDGDTRTDRLPSRIRGISPGAHTVAIDAPPGFLSQNQAVTVEAGKSPRIDITLSPVEGITGTFESTPPGAEVSLIVDGKRVALGESPAKASLDPRKTYQVLFERPGYVSLNRPIVLSGVLDEKIVVNLEKASPTSAVAVSPPTSETHPAAIAKAPAPVVEHKIAVATPVEHKSAPLVAGASPAAVERKAVTVPTPAPAESADSAEVKAPAEVADAKPKGKGTLLLGSKPPCDIVIDGNPTGLHTPQRDIKLDAGKHRVTLVNAEFGIKEAFTVDIKADQVEKQIKDYSDRIPQ